MSDCDFCNEPMIRPDYLDLKDQIVPPAHRECLLREVTGGIGHLIAHEWWCPGGKSGRDDPDAGLSRRQSALLVDAWVRIVGLEHLP